jgi:hypothetical protein
MFSHTLPAGRYFIGDPSYILSQDDYRAWCAEDHAQEGKFTLRGSTFVIHGEIPSDGGYLGSDGVMYSTDVCDFALIPESLFDPIKRKKLERREAQLRPEGSFHTFTGPVKFTWQYRVFTITCPQDAFHLAIDTNARDE